MLVSRNEHHMDGKLALVVPRRAPGPPLSPGVTLARATGTCGVHGQAYNEGRDMAKPSAPATTGIVRLNVNLNAETADALKQLADEKGSSLTEVIRRAIAVYKFIADEARKGNRIQTVDPKTNEVRELVLM